tara:strand:+ start:330 stop:1466 length:1137 start_codon:yes stop_codon:yes gene_type:complete
MAKQGFKIMDSDLHVLEPSDIFERYLEEPFLSRAPRKEKAHLSGLEKWVVGDHYLPYWADEPEAIKADAALRDRKEKTPFQVEAFNNKFDPATTVEAMDIEGVDVAVLYRTVGGMLAQAFDVLEPEFLTALCKAYNNWMKDYCDFNQERLKGVAMISLADIDGAVEEVKRAVQELGFWGISVHPDPIYGRILYDPEVEPFWEECERQNVSVGIHGTSTGVTQDDIGRKLFSHPAGRIVSRSISFPVPLMWSLAGVITSGVIERHPGLRIAFLEGNAGWLPWFLYRLDELYHKHGYPKLERDPSSYFQSNCYIGTDVDEYGVADVINRLGDDNIVVSTDYPHFDSAFPYAMDEFLELDISDQSKRKILWDNCVRYYGKG